MFCDNCVHKNNTQVIDRLMLYCSEGKCQYWWCTFCRSDYFLDNRIEFVRTYLSVEESKKIMESYKFKLSKRCPNYVENIIYDNMEESE